MQRTISAHIDKGLHNEGRKYRCSHILFHIYGRRPSFVFWAPFLAFFRQFWISKWLWHDVTAGPRRPHATKIFTISKIIFWISRRFSDCNLFSTCAKAIRGSNNFIRICNSFFRHDKLLNNDFKKKTGDLNLFFPVNYFLFFFLFVKYFSRFEKCFEIVPYRLENLQNLS